MKCDYPNCEAGSAGTYCRASCVQLTSDRAVPQRKPLTDDEIKKLLIEHAGMTVVFSEVDLRFARAIERAHGIGGQP